MDKIAVADLKLGIIAGGQLGKMLIQEASKWDIATYVLDRSEQCPAAGIATGFVCGSALDYGAVYRFGKKVDVLTFEIEHVNIPALQQLKSEGVKVLPDPDTLALVQDKGFQKQFYARHGIPTAAFSLFSSAGELQRAIDTGAQGFPFVQKLRKGGYDGRGVAVVNAHDDVPKILDGASVVEQKVDVWKEISVIVARRGSGEVQAFPVVEMQFDPRSNLVERLACPSDISPEQASTAVEYACRIISLMNMEGLLAVEFFIDTEGTVLVNEAAPRPHNSGHHTIESCITSQFEQHLRAILDLPLGSTALRYSSVMLNILGADGEDGPVQYHGIEECMAIEGVKIHLYGKKVTSPNRKMGHVTIVSPTLAGAQEKAERVKQLLKVKICK